MASYDIFFGHISASDLTKTILLEGNKFTKWNLPARIIRAKQSASSPLDFLPIDIANIILTLLKLRRSRPQRYQEEYIQYDEKKDI